jgi:putative spermidine/putrescine transport system substrate-binding protein
MIAKLRRIATLVFGVLAVAYLSYVFFHEPGEDAGADRLVISVFGVSQESFRKHLYDPFEAECGCKLVIETGNSSERLSKLAARKTNPEVDLAVFADFDALSAARRGLTDPIDVAKLGNYDRLYEFARDPIGGRMAVGYTVYAAGIVYRTDKVRIESWNDLWQPVLKDRMVLPTLTSSGGPMMLHMVESALGGNDPAFRGALAKVAANKESVVTFYERSAHLVQLFQQGEAWAAVTGRYNLPLLQRLDLPIAWATPQEGDAGGRNVMVLIRGSRRRALALRLMDKWLSTPVQMALALDLTDSPANREVVLPPATASLLTYGPAMIQRMKFVPPAQVLDHRAAWTAAWNETIAR